LDFFFESRRDCPDSTINQNQYKKLNDNVLMKPTEVQSDSSESLDTVNLEARRKYYREYYEKNKEKIREISRKHYEKNRERIIARVKNNPKYNK
jgi:hypothetical protein